MAIVLQISAICVCLSAADDTVVSVLVPLLPVSFYNGLPFIGAVADDVPYVHRHIRV